MNLKGKNFLKLLDFSPEEIGGLLQLAADLKAQKKAGVPHDLLRGKKVHDKPYYKKFAPHIDWEWMLVVGVILGALLSSKLSGTFGVEWVPAHWQAAAGDTSPAPGAGP